MKRNIDRDLIRDFWNLLEQLQTLLPQQVYENQDFYLDLLRLLCNKNFRHRIKMLRTSLDIPIDWYSYPRNHKPNYKELYSLHDSHPDSPQKPTDQVIIDLCDSFGLDALRYGWFLIYYIYSADLSIGKDRATSLIANGEFRHKARIVIKGNKSKYKSNIFEDHHLIGYIQFFSNTTPKGLEEFVKDNMRIITNLQKIIASYPQIGRLRGVVTFKRDLEIFLLAQLGLSDSQIANIMHNTPLPKEIDLMQKSFEVLSAHIPSDKITLLQRNYPITNRKTEDIYNRVSEETVRNSISSIKRAVFKKNDKSVK